MGAEPSMSESWYSAMLSFSGDVLYRIQVAPEVEVLFMGGDVLAATGYPVSEFYNNPGLARRMIDPRDFSAWAGILEAPLDEYLIVEARWTKPSGQTAWAEHRMVRRLREDGSIVVEGLGRDVTARKLSDNELASHKETQRLLTSSEKRYRMLAEHASDIVWQVSPTGRIDWCSESSYSVLGWRPDQLIGVSIENLFHSADGDTVAESFDSFVSPGSSSAEFRILRPDGSSVWMDVSSASVDTQDGLVRVVSMRHVQAEVEARGALAHAVGHDPLTGLASRNLVLSRIASHQQSISEEWGLVGVLCVGIDALSQINDAYSYVAGDMVLSALAERFQEEVGDRELLGRGPGAEFIVILPNLPFAPEAAVMAERLRKAAKPPVFANHKLVQPTVSIGISVGTTSSEPEQLVRDAATAMRKAKAEGRDRYAFMDTALAVSAQRRFEVEDQVRLSLSNDEFVPWFQPVVSLEDFSLVGYEALARCMSQTSSLSPEEFIGVAEHSNLIAEIDMSILRQSIDMLARIPSHLTIAVNVSAATLAKQGYADQVISWLSGSGVDPARLHLEVTETTLLKMTRFVKDNLTRTAEAGIRWYVDDFGTGYSSISHLRDLPISGLKLDISFTAGLRDPDSKNQHLSRALVGLASGLVLDTVAEGVELSEDVEALKSQGWKHAQGWFFGKAAPLLPASEDAEPHNTNSA